MIDLTRPITFQDSTGSNFNFNTLVGALTFSGGGTPLSGYSVSGFGIGSVSPIGYEDNRATSDGIDASEAYAGRRIVTLALDVYGNSKSDLYQKLQNVVNVMRFMPKRYEGSDGFRKLKATMLTTDPNFSVNEDTGNREIPIYFYARPMLIPQTESNTSQFSGSDSLGYSAKLLLQFLLKYPYKYSDSPNEAEIPIDGTEIDIQNHGSAPSEMQLIISADDTNSDIVDITITVAGVPITLDVTETMGIDGSVERSILIDYKDQVVYIREQDIDSNVVTQSLRMNMIDVNSGALFATIEPTADLTEPATISISIVDEDLNPVTTGYSALMTTRECWY